MFCLQGRNYRFTIKQTFMPINPDGCAVVASKTKKNILITIAVSCNMQYSTPVMHKDYLLKQLSP